MSAIAGLWVQDGERASEALLARMSASMAHRGADHSGLHVDGCIGLANRASFSTPESFHERQPLTLGSRTITGDLRVDNRQELFASLGIERDQATGMTDAELVLRCHQRFGEDCANRIAGDFAFAIWDEARKSLYCARDPFAIRPFFYATTGATFAFASEIRSLLLLPGISRDVDELKIAEFLAGSVDDAERTFRRDIRRLRGGHWLTHADGRTRIVRYWNLDPRRELKLRSDEEYRVAFRDLFAECVRSRMRTVHPIGSTLSGGMDSSSIASMARWLRHPSPGSPIHTFGAIFPGLPEKDLRDVDERSYAHDVTSMPGIEPHEVSMVDIGFLTEIDRVMWFQEEPFFGPNVYIHWALYAAARRAGVRVFLDGLDGDTTISYGYERLTQLAVTLRWLSMWREAKAVADRIDHPSVGTRSVLRYHVIAWLVPQSLRKLRGRNRPALTPAWGQHGLILPEFAKRVGVHERLQAMARADPQEAVGRGSHWAGIRSPLLQYVMELADKASSAFGLDCRYPFLDRRLAEFCLALPLDQKLRHGWTRYILRTGLEGILPPSIVSRVDKSNLGANLRAVKPEDRAGLAHVVELARTHLRPYLDVQALEAGFASYFERPSESFSILLHSASSLALWFEAEAKGPRPTPPPGADRILETGTAG